MNRTGRTLLGGLAGVVAALVGAAALLGAPVARPLHLVRTQHVACPEHGELVHVGRGVLSTEASPRAPFAAPAAASGVDGHEHCGLSSGTQHTGAWPPAAYGVAVAVLLPTRGGGCGRLAVASRRLYLIAPKQSPTA